MEGYILGISCGYHDSAAALIKDGKVLGAVEEERFTGIKHDSSFPVNTIKWLYDEFKISGEDITAVAFYDNPKNKLDRIEKSVKRGPLTEYFNRKKIIKRNKDKFKTFEGQVFAITNQSVSLYYSDHHLSHASYSFYTSPYNKATILSVDGVGEWETTTLWYGEGTKIAKLQQIDFPHSLGMLYSTFTAFLGFKPNEGEYKVFDLNGKQHIFYANFFLSDAIPSIKHHIVGKKNHGPLNLEQFTKQKEIEKDQGSQLNA